MKGIGEKLFRAIHERKWLEIEYRNSHDEKTRYWIAIKEINIEKKSLTVVGLHIGRYTMSGLFLFVDSILSAKIIDGTYYEGNESLLEDIELFPDKYSFIFPNVTNLKILNYLSDCNKLADTPKLYKDYPMIKRIDAAKFVNGIYQLDGEQYKIVVNSFKKGAEIKEKKQNSSVLQLAMNVLSIETPKGLYVLAYKEILFDVVNKTLRVVGETKICSEFSVDGIEKKSVLSFLDADEVSMLEFSDREDISEFLNDSICSNIKNKRGYRVDDCPHLFCLQRNSNINLEKEYEAVYEMYSSGNVSMPIKAFFGELLSVQPNEEVLPIALIDNKVNLDQLLAIHNAMNYPIAYIQGPPGTGKTSTIINTIITAFFNDKTVLFSSYNNHPIDGVFEKLTNLKYKSYTIPFPVLRIGKNDSIPDTIEYIRKLMATVNRLNVYGDVLFQNKKEQIGRTKKLCELLQRYEEKIDLEERRNLVDEMLSKTQNMSLQFNLEGQQKTLIQKRLDEIGEITDAEALGLLNFNYLKIAEYLNFTSVKFIKKLFDPEYKDFHTILCCDDRETQIGMFNKYFSSSENVEKMMKVFPVICSTCISTQKIGEPKQYFDMTVIDEASQCNTAVSLVPVIRGKSLMLVGDPQQLNPVITLDNSINEELKTKYKVSESYDYIKNSIYKAYLANDSVSQETLLHNHYRCAKEIIEFNNQKYYNSQLRVKSAATEIEPLCFCDVVDDYSVEKNTAPEEAEQIISYVKQNPDKSIGVITPFVSQKEYIIGRLREERLEDKVSCGTVHAFQGDEKDEILFSLAVTDKTHSKTYEWLKNNNELINVAVSRAKNKLTIISNRKALEKLHYNLDKNDKDDLYDLAKYVQSKGSYKVAPVISSSRALGIKPYSTQTENAFLETLEQALSNLFEDNSKYVVKTQVQLSHVFEKLSKEEEYFFRSSFDFVIYRLGHKNVNYPVFAIELNGPEHLSDSKVQERDRKKEEICERYKFTLIRVSNDYARRYNYIKQILTSYFNSK